MMTNEYNLSMKEVNVIGRLYKCDMASESLRLVSIDDNGDLNFLTPDGNYDRVCNVDAKFKEVPILDNDSIGKHYLSEADRVIKIIGITKIPKDIDSDFEYVNAFVGHRLSNPSSMIVYNEHGEPYVNSKTTSLVKQIRLYV